MSLSVPVAVANYLDKSSLREGLFQLPLQEQSSMVGKSKQELEAAGYMTTDSQERAMDKTAACPSAAQYIFSVYAVQDSSPGKWSHSQ